MGLQENYVGGDYGWSPEHDSIAGLIDKVGRRGGDATFDSLVKASNAFNKSLKHHSNGSFRDAHNELQIAAEHIGTAASLGAADGADPYYGMAMTPKELADHHVRSYKHGYLS